MSSPLRILQIAPRLPWPLSIGGNIGIFNITRALSRLGHEITFVCFATDTSDPSPMSTFCDVRIVRHDTSTRALSLFTNLFSTWPYTISKYRCAAMHDTLRKLCRERSFDVVHVDHIHMAPYGVMLKEEFGLPLIIREHNFETTIYERFALQQTFPPLAWYMHMQTRRLLRFETRHVLQADVVAAITDEDAARIRQAAVVRHMEIVPAGVDLDAHNPSDPSLEHSATITLLGSMAWEPNLDAVLWFVSQIWPRIAGQHTGARLIIAGAAPPRRIRELASERIEVRGFVEDLSGLLASSTVLAVPLRVGGGMRIKLLEYFARAKAVVSTSIGAEGNLGRDGAHLLIADDAEDFAAATLRLLHDPQLRRRLGAAARKLTEEVYSWEVIGRSFVQCYHNALGERR
ncbi:MAG: glycosyltransferase family 4 protein [Bacteroidia bacterium]|nr:glycosyltransferase family 4 protein [Bacteroidia bacterium]